MKKRTGIHLLLTSFLSLTLPSGTLLASEQEPAPLTFDNLVPVEGGRMQSSFLDPQADFSVFRRVAILNPAIAFRSNWQRDQNRSRSRNVSRRDMERIKEAAARLFQQVFSERLEAAGYTVTEEAGEDVLILRPAIIDLDVSAPDTRTPGMSQTFTTTSAAANLYIELFDGLTGDIVGRAMDRQVVRNAGGHLSWSNSVTNIADARRMFGHWADILVSFLDSHYKK